MVVKACRMHIHAVVVPIPAQAQPRRFCFRKVLHDRTGRLRGFLSLLPLGRPTLRGVLISRSSAIMNREMDIVLFSFAEKLKDMSILKVSSYIIK